MGKDATKQVILFEKMKGSGPGPCHWGWKHPHHDFWVSFVIVFVCVAGIIVVDDIEPIEFVVAVVAVVAVIVGVDLKKISKQCPKTALLMRNPEFLSKCQRRQNECVEYEECVECVEYEESEDWDLL